MTRNNPLTIPQYKDLLTRLVDQSLVTTHRVEGGTTRYSMLETVRQYAHERLIEAGESGESECVVCRLSEIFITETKR